MLKRRLAPVFVLFSLGLTVGCSSESAAVLEKCKAETKVATCQTCCEAEGWEKGSTVGGECECSKQSGTAF